MNTVNQQVRTPLWQRGMRIAAMILMGLTAACLMALAFGYFVKFLWNNLLPTLFNVAEINYWQAVGLIFLARLMFGAFRPHNNHPETGSSQKRKAVRDWIHGGKFPTREMKKDWGHFHEFWQSEGKQAYESFVEEKYGSSE